VLEVDPAAHARLRGVARETVTRFSAAFNDALCRTGMGLPPIDDAFRFTSRLCTLVNYPEALAPHWMRALPSTHFLNGCLRAESADPGFQMELAALDRSRPTVYLSFGSFLSARGDVLGTAIRALLGLPVNVIIATGVADTAEWGTLPHDWLVRPVIPQLAALAVADLVIGHGGNNTITEALAAGVPLLIGPFSSDQFDNAADVEAAGLGAVFAPNTIEPDELRALVVRTLNDKALRERMRSVRVEMERVPGAFEGARIIGDTVRDLHGLALAHGGTWT
jgi:MGT family glycosyltransferase